MTFPSHEKTTTDTGPLEWYCRSHGPSPWWRKASAEAPTSVGAATILARSRPSCAHFSRIQTNFLTAHSLQKGWPNDQPGPLSPVAWPRLSAPEGGGPNISPVRERWGKERPQNQPSPVSGGSTPATCRRIRHDSLAHAQPHLSRTPGPSACTAVSTQQPEPTGTQPVTWISVLRSAAFPRSNVHPRLRHAPRSHQTTCLTNQPTAPPTQHRPALAPPTQATSA